MTAPSAGSTTTRRVGSSPSDSLRSPAAATAEEVSRTGVPQRLEAMTPFERKVVHDAVAAAGLRSESEGEEPTRRVVVLPAEGAVMEPAGGQG